MSDSSFMINVTLPDGTVSVVPAGTPALEVLRESDARLAGRALLLRADDELIDLARPLGRDVSLHVLTQNDDEALEALRHSTAHATAQAVQERFPRTKIAQGPPIEDGFYYDFDRDEPFSEKDLAAIEARVREIVERDLPIERIEMSRDEALAFFREEDEPYKIFFAETKGGEVVSIYRQGDWTDFCRGPHMASTGKLRAFKLLSVAGAYWLGDERNKMLQRIYGTAFFSEKDLRRHLALLEEARKRDHRKLGRELKLFSFHPEAPASPFFHPNGATIYRELIRYVEAQYVRYGYSLVITPQIFDVSLWKQSGHYEHYRENMFFTEVDERQYAVKPMNCPGHCLMYGEGRHSYRELPIRLADFGRLHRYELSGAVAGLTRVRSFSQDDAHIYCTPEQVHSEVASLTEMYLACYGLFDFEVKIVLSLRPPDRAGDDAQWDHAEAALRSALDAQNVEYATAPGEGAFYGPKIDFIVRDALKRQHQLGTIQLDYVLPERFGLRYIDSEDNEQRPVMIHRAMLGSLERFIGILIEHCGGSFPFWLAPEQVRVMSITDRAAEYAKQVQQRFEKRKLRATADVRNETIRAKIRGAQLQKVPVMLVVGDREAEAGTVALRMRKQGDLGAVALDELLAQAEEWTEQRPLRTEWKGLERDEASRS